MSWECDSNNYVGHSRVPVSMETLNKEVWDIICDFLEQIDVNTKESGVNVSQKSHGIKG